MLRIASIWAICAVAAAGTARAGGSALPVMELDAVKAKRVGLTFRVEGRITSITEQSISFERCSMPFRAATIIDKTRLFTGTRRPTNLEVTGTLKKENGKYVFEVIDVEVSENDLNQYLARQTKVRGSDPASWYELAEWGRRRAEFYEDRELLARANSAMNRGFEIERKALRDDDVRGRAALAEKGKTLGISSEILEDLLHETHHLRRLAMAREEKPAWLELARAIERDLPGAAEPLAADRPLLTRNYLEAPLTTYRGMPDERRTFHRLLRNVVVLAGIESQADENGANGFEIARQIDERVPEKHDLAESYREKALARQSQEVAALSRQQVIELAARYRERNDAEKADAALESWLTLRRRQLAPNDIDGLLEIAEDYTRLLQRPEVTVALLTAADAQFPGTEAIVERLTKLGWKKNGNRWLSPAEAARIPEDPIERALREGRVVVGMTPDLVRRSQGGPQSVTRIAAAGAIEEIWTYGAAGEPSLIVRFVRRSRTHAARVVAVESPGDPGTP